MCKMDTLDKCRSSTEGKEKLMIELFLEDFEKQNWEIKYRTKGNISKLKNSFYLLYAFDLIICHILIGNKLFKTKTFTLNYEGPSVVAFWRGIWDFSNYWCVYFKGSL